jgi:hypothetical protein
MVKGVFRNFYETFNIRLTNKTALLSTIRNVESDSFDDVPPIEEWAYELPDMDEIARSKIDE